MNILNYILLAAIVVFALAMLFICIGLFTGSRKDNSQDEPTAASADGSAADAADTSEYPRRTIIKRKTPTKKAILKIGASKTATLPKIPAKKAKTVKPRKTLATATILISRTRKREPQGLQKPRRPRSPVRERSSPVLTCRPAKKA